MKRFKNAFVEILGIVLILCFNGCSTQTETVATSADGVEINFAQKGSGNPSIIFVHGWSNTLSIWNEQIDHFSQKYTVAGIDLAGFGKSGNNRKEWTMSAFGDDVVAVIDKLNLDQVVLVGFSMGGSVAIEVAKKLPQRITGIVLVDTMQDPEKGFPPEAIDFIDSVYMDIVTHPAPEKLEGIFYKNNKEQAFTRILEMLDGASHIGWRESLHETGRWMNEDCVASLQSIQTPIIAINSDNEPTNVDFYNKTVPSFNLHIMKDVGHVVFWDKPDEFNILLEESVQDFLMRK